MSVAAYKCLVGEEPAQEVEPGVFVGAVAATRNAAWLKAHDITHVLTVAVGNVWGRNTFPRPACVVAHTQVPVDDDGWLAPDAYDDGSQDIEDLSTFRFWRHLDRCFDAIYAAREAKTGILVHCQAGVNRSAATVAAWLMLRHDLEFDAALERVRAVRPCVRPRAAMREQVEQYFADLWNDAPRDGAVQDTRSMSVPSLPSPFSTLDDATAMAADQKKSNTAVSADDIQRARRDLIEIYEALRDGKTVPDTKAHIQAPARLAAALAFKVPSLRWSDYSYPSDDELDAFVKAVLVPLGVVPSAAGADAKTGGPARKPRHEQLVAIGTWTLALHYWLPVVIDGADMPPGVSRFAASDLKHLGYNMMAAFTSAVRKAGFKLNRVFPPILAIQQADRKAWQLRVDFLIQERTYLGKTATEPWRETMAMSDSFFKLGDEIGSGGDWAVRSAAIMDGWKLRMAAFEKAEASGVDPWDVLQDG